MLQPEQGVAPPPHAAADRSLRVIVCGEINSGKSTVINTLLRSNLVPNYMGSAWRPPVLVRHDRAPGLFVKYQDDRVERVASLEPGHNFEEVIQCIVQTDAPHLKGFEIIEMPFFHDGEVLDEALDFMASADILVWVTIASQAWRLTEKTVMDRLGKRRPKHSLLVVSRADKLRTERDATKIRDRVEKETAEYFRHVTFLSGARSLIERARSSDEAWGETAGQELMQVLDLQASEIRSDEAETGRAGGAGYGTLPPSALAAAAAAAPQPAPQPAAPAEVVDLAAWRSAGQPRRAEAEAAPAPAAPVRAETARAEPTAPGVAQAEFIRSAAPRSEVSRPEISRPEIARPGISRDEPARPAAEAAAPADPADELRQLVRSMHGFCGAGVARLDGAPDIMVLAGDAELSEGLAEFCRNSLSRHQDAFGAGSERIETTFVVLKERSLLYQVLPQPGLVVFAMCENSKINTGVARTAMARLSSAVARRYGA